MAGTDLGLSIGVALYPEHAETPQDLWRSANQALLKAKSGDTAVKYVTHPVNCANGKIIRSNGTTPEDAGEDYLRIDLAAKLAAKEVCFGLYLQPLPKSADQEELRSLVEDTRMDFGTNEVRVGLIRVPVQQIDTPSKQQYCENLSFNPWQAGVEHQPLGGMNRARKVAVTASSIRRHLFTGADRQEPVSLEAYRAQ